ncbi:T9SS type A sorting domain-containing protein [Tenacibaculum xiamenense]|uniref:T9SS type A sorting domain-containing protein n=1 Tax=Tenacibaculum xiamenense TaxID=1261553 RepID=UPI003892D23A
MFFKVEWKVLLLSLLLPIMMVAQQKVGVSYYDSELKYVEYIPGDLPILLVAPHGGNLMPESIDSYGSRGIDRNSKETTLLVYNRIVEMTGRRPHLIMNHLNPCKFNPAKGRNSVVVKYYDKKSKDTIYRRVKDTAFIGDLYDKFHDFIKEASNSIRNSVWEKGHYFEMHGVAGGKNMIGIGLQKKYLVYPDDDTNVSLKYTWKESTVKNLIRSGSPDVSERKKNYVSVLRGENSLGTLLDSIGSEQWKSVPSKRFPSQEEDKTFFYTGANLQKHCTDPKDYEDGRFIDGTHMENYWLYMDYMPNRNRFSRYTYSKDLAKAMLVFMEKNYGFELINKKKGKMYYSSFEKYTSFDHDELREVWVESDENREEVDALNKYGNYGKSYTVLSGENNLESKVLDFSAFEKVYMYFNIRTDEKWSSGQKIRVEVSVDGGVNYIAGLNLFPEKSSKRHFRVVCPKKYINNKMVFRFINQNDGTKVCVDDIVLTTNMTWPPMIMDLTRKVNETSNIFEDIENKKIDDQDVVVYPNPAIEYIQVKLPENELLHVEIIDCLGKVVKRKMITKKTENGFLVSTSSIPPGVYTLVIKDENFIKQNQVKILIAK